jgi:hypothetical protein
MKGKITLYPLEVFTDLHFCLQSFKCDTLPLKLSNCGNLTTLTFSFPKCPYHIFYFILKKSKKKKRTKNQKKKMKEILLGWFSHPNIYIFFNKIKYVMGAFWEKKGLSGRIATI